MKIGFYGGKFLPLHIGHVNCIIQANNMCDKLYIGVSHSEIRDRELCNGKMPYISVSKRMQWISQLTSDLPNVEVFEFEDFDSVDYNSWDEGADKVKSYIGQPIDYVFGSEIEYECIFNRLYPTAEYVIVDSSRSTYNISATEIRRDGAFAHWDFIPNVCRPFFNKRVVIVGTESCGKSTIVRNLAKYYNTEYVEEYGRVMCNELNTGQPTEEYYPFIAYGHKMLEFQKNKTANKLLFIDTEAIVTQFYSNLYINRTFNVLNEMAKIEDYDLWIFLMPDVKWVDDGLRIHGTEEQRNQNNETLKRMLIENGKNFIEVSGNYQERFLKVVEEVNKLVN